MLAQYSGSIENPWDEIGVQYVMVTTHVARKRPSEAFDEQHHLISYVHRVSDFGGSMTCTTGCFSAFSR